MIFCVFYLLCVLSSIKYIHILFLMIDPVDVSCVSDGIAILTVLASPEHAGRHGACRLTDEVSG